METLNLSIRYRPVRIGWCIRNGDKASLRKAIRHNFCLWGGAYNPIIPIDDLGYATNLIKKFRVDVLWAPNKDDAFKEFLKNFSHLPNPFYDHDTFVSTANGSKAPQFIDIYHPIRRLYRDEFKTSDPKVRVKIYRWDDDDPLSDTLLSGRGALPPPGETGTDYEALLLNDLKAEEVFIGKNDVIPPVEENTWPLGKFSRDGVDQHFCVYSDWQTPAVYFGSASNFDDLINCWNLRAAKTPILFFDPEHSRRLEAIKTRWENLVGTQPRMRRELSDGIEIWSSRDAKECAEYFGKNISVNEISKKFWANTGVSVPYMYFSEARTLASIGGGNGRPPSLSFQLPKMPVEEDPALYHQRLVVGINPMIGLFGDEKHTLHAPNIPEINEFFGRRLGFIWNIARAEPDGIGFITSASEDSLTLKSLEVESLFVEIFKTSGIGASPSKPGRIAARLIRQMGGIQDCRVFKLSGVRSLIENHSPQQTFTRGHATQTIWGNGAISKYQDVYIEARESGAALKATDVFDYLLKKNVFRAGLRFECPICRLEFWQPLDDVSTEATCEYCGGAFNVMPYLKDRDWAYRRSGLFGREDHQEGAIPVTLTLMQLHTMFHSSDFLYETAMKLQPQGASIEPCEVDFIGLIPSSRRDKTQIVLGECKTRIGITEESVKKLQKVALSFPEDKYQVFVLFAKLAPFSPEELQCVKNLNNKSKRAILLGSEDLETYHVYEDAKYSDGSKRYVISLEDMADETHKAYLANC